MRSSRLKNFCEVCRKQCKDQNGYHCHLNSAKHQIKLREFASNPEQHIEKYSKQLEGRFLQMLKVKYPGVAKNVEDLYEEYAQQKHHIKFNHTQWKDLNQFIEHLRKNGRNLKIVGKGSSCTVTYLVSKSGDFIKKKRQEQLNTKIQKQKQMMKMKLEERMAKNREIEEQIFEQMKRKVIEEQNKTEEFTGDRLQIKFNTEIQAPKRSNLFTVEELAKQCQGDLQSAPRKVKNVDRLFEKLEEKEKKIVQKEQKQKNQNNEDDEDDFEWIMQGITVKVLPHQIPEAFHNKKTSITSIKQPYTATLQLGNAFLNVDQTYLETVIPKIGHSVKILKGVLRGKKGSLFEVDVENGIGIIQIEGQKFSIPFNQFSKSD